MTARMKAITKAKHENDREKWLKQNNNNQTSLSEIKPVWTKESTFTVNTEIIGENFIGGQIIKENFIDETGIFYIEVQLKK